MLERTGPVDRLDEELADRVRAIDDLNDQVSMLRESERKRAAELNQELETRTNGLNEARRLQANATGEIETERKRAAELPGKDLVAFTEIVSFKQPWERAFDTLTAFLAPSEPKRPAAPPPRKIASLGPQ